MGTVKAFEELSAGSHIYSLSNRGEFHTYRVVRMGTPHNKLLIPIGLKRLPARENTEFTILLGRRACSDVNVIDRESKVWELLFTDRRQALSYLKAYKKHNEL